MPKVDVTEHVNAIWEWIAEAKEDQGIEGDEVAFDVVTSYISAYVDGGEGSPTAKQIRRQFFGEA